MAQFSEKTTLGLERTDRSLHHHVTSTLGRVEYLNTLVRRMSYALAPTGDDVARDKVPVGSGLFEKLNAIDREMSELEKWLAALEVAIGDPHGVTGTIEKGPGRGTQGQGQTDFDAGPHRR